LIFCIALGDGGSNHGVQNTSLVNIRSYTPNFSLKTSNNTNNKINVQQPPSNSTTTHLNLNLKDPNSRNYLWNLLKVNSPTDELTNQFGSILHDKITFWDLAQLKLKHSKSNHLKTTYQIIDEYTILYSNMRTYLEKIVNSEENHNIGSSIGGISLSLVGSSSNRSSSNEFNNNNNNRPKSSSSRRSAENSSRSRSSSRNPRKQSVTANTTTSTAITSTSAASTNLTATATTNR
jgi:hypothetical protein